MTSYKIDQKSFAELQSLASEIRVFTGFYGHRDKLDLAIDYHNDDIVFLPEKELSEKIEQISLNDEKFWDRYVVLNRKYFEFLEKLSDRLIDVLQEFEREPTDRDIPWSDVEYRKTSILSDLQQAIRRLESYIKTAPEDTYTFWEHHNWVDILLGRKFVNLGDGESKSATAAEILPVFYECLKILEEDQFDAAALVDFHGSQHCCSLTSFAIQ